MAGPKSTAFTPCVKPGRLQHGKVGKKKQLWVIFGPKKLDLSSLKSLKLSPDEKQVCKFSIDQHQYVMEPMDLSAQSSLGLLLPGEDGSLSLSPAAPKAFVISEEIRFPDQKPLDSFHSAELPPIAQPKDLNGRFIPFGSQE